MGLYNNSVSGKIVLTGILSSPLFYGVATLIQFIRLKAEVFDINTKCHYQKK